MGADIKNSIMIKRTRRTSMAAKRNLIVVNTAAVKSGETKLADW